MNNHSDTINSEGIPTFDPDLFCIVDATEEDSELVADAALQVFRTINKKEKDERGLLVMNLILNLVERGGGFPMSYLASVLIYLYRIKARDCNKSILKRLNGPVGPFQLVLGLIIIIQKKTHDDKTEPFKDIQDLCRKTDAAKLDSKFKTKDITHFHSLERDILKLIDYRLEIDPDNFNQLLVLLWEFRTCEINDDWFDELIRVLTDSVPSNIADSNRSKDECFTVLSTISPNQA